MHNEIVFDVSAAAIKNQIDPRIDIFVLNLAICLDAGLPSVRLIADEVVRLTLEFLNTVQSTLNITVKDFDCDYVRRWPLLPISYSPMS